MTGLVIVFLLRTRVIASMALPAATETGAALGFPGAGMARALGLILLVCTVLYIAPRTTVLGAILLSAYLGGAVATQLRVGAPLFTHLVRGLSRRPAVGWALASRHAGPGALPRVAPKLLTNTDLSAQSYPK